MTKSIRSFLGAFAVSAALLFGAVAATPAYAAGESAQGDPTGVTELTTVTFEKDFTLTGFTSLPNDYTFTFTMEPTTNTVTERDGLPVEQGVVGASGNPTAEVTFTSSNTTVNGTTISGTATGTFTLPTDVTLAANTIYTYKVSETDSSGFTATGGPFILELYTNKDAKIVYAVARNTSNTVGKTPLKFVNTRSDTTASLEVSKTVAGNFADSDDEFTFKIRLIADETHTAGATYQITFYDKDGDGTSDLSSLTTQTVSVVTEGSTEATEIILKDKGSFALSNLPVGIKYEIQEVKADGYTTTLESSSGATLDATENSMTSTIAAVGNTEDFTNTRGTVATGVLMDVAPYAAIAVIAIAGAMALIVRRRNNAQED